MDVIRDFWGVIGAVVGAIVWLVRLEGRTNANTTELTRQRDQRAEDTRVTASYRLESNEILAEIRADLKTLMQKVGR